MIFESFAYFLSRINLFTNFVNTVNGFPKPLSLEEEKELFKKKKEGDSFAREKLISHNLRLVSHIVKKYTNSLEVDDLISVGTIGLVKAIDTFNYEKNVQFSTYAARCINNEILMLIRSNKKHKDVVSLSSVTTSSEDDKDLELLDVLSSDEEEIYMQVENKILTKKIIKIIEENLSEREKKVIYMRYGIFSPRAYTQKEIAQILCISRSYISRIENKAISLIKEKIGQNLDS